MLDIRQLSLAERKQLAQNENTPCKILNKLARSKNEIKRLVAKNPNTHIETPEKLSDEFYEEVIENPVFELLLLENSDRHFLKSCLAKSTKTPAETLDKLCGEGSMEIYREVARNTNTPANTLVKLAPLPYCSILRRVASNRNTPIDVLGTLAQDSEFNVVEAIALYFNTPAIVLEKLHHDDRQSVREAAA